MPVIRDIPTSDPSPCDIGASSCLPRELLAEIFERISLPVVLDRGTGDVVLNAKARSLWQITDADSSSLPLVVDGERQSLLALLSALTNGVGPPVTPLVRVPGGEQYELDVLPWKRAADSHTWRLAILQPLDQGGTEGRLLAGKTDRLKAIVHEFRNTLTAAREALAFLQEGVVGELNVAQRRFLNSAVEDLERLVRALVDLTSLWVTRAGVLRMVARPVDIGRVVEQTTLCAQSAAVKHGISLRVEIGEPPPILTGDHELLVQALRNVITNALRHTAAGGEIRVRAFVVDAAKAADAGDAGDAFRAAQSECSSAGESVVIEVHDSGSGIGPVDQERVFRPFERGDTAGSAQGSAGSGGMGLGLTIARDIASTHGGTLHVRSAPGEGSCFVFRFPKAEACARSWMARATQRAIEDVRPLGAPLAGVLLRFVTDNGDPEERLHPDLLSAAQQVAIQNLRPADTVVAIEGQLLLLIRGGTRSAAYATIDRLLQSLVEMFRACGASLGECSMMFGIAVYPEDGDSPEAILARAEAELSAFSIGVGRGTEESHEREADDPAGR